METPIGAKNYIFLTLDTKWTSITSLHTFVTYLRRLLLRSKTNNNSGSFWFHNHLPGHSYTLVISFESRWIGFNHIFKMSRICAKETYKHFHHGTGVMHVVNINKLNSLCSRIRANNILWLSTWRKGSIPLILSTIGWCCIIKWYPRK